MALIFFADCRGSKLYATIDLALGSAVLAEANFVLHAWLKTNGCKSNK